MRYRRTVLVLVFAGFLFVPRPGHNEDVTTGMAEVNSTKLYYEMAGEGHPLVLIHGGILDSAE